MPEVIKVTQFIRVTIPWHAEKCLNGNGTLTTSLVAVTREGQRRLDMCHITSLALCTWPIAAVGVFNLLQP